MSHVYLRRARMLSGLMIIVLLGLNQSLLAATAPTTYSAYTGTDAKAIPAAPALGPVNSTINDPTFGSRILRVTDANTSSRLSFEPEYAGTVRSWNANSTAVKLLDAYGGSYWLEFNPSSFTVGNGSSQPSLHRLNFNWAWEWSAVDPDTLYFLNGKQLAKYNKATGVIANLGGPPNGDPVTYHVAVIGADNWVCAAAGAGTQNTYTKLYCINPSNTSQAKFIDVLNKTINGISQSDPNWPTSAAGQTIGIHSLYGSATGAYFSVTFRQQSWGANGDAVLNLTTNTWSLVTPADPYWGGHNALGNGKYVIQGGSINGMDGRGAVLRDPNALMNSSKYVFIYQPPSTIGFYDSDHLSWFNASTNAQAPVLSSRYNVNPPPGPLTWYGEIVVAATDGSNTVWRFAHNHNGGVNLSFFACSFAQISNDGRWAVFSSYWDGTLGTSGGDFGVGTRIDTFIVDLVTPASPPPPPPPSPGPTCLRYNPNGRCLKWSN